MTIIFRAKTSEGFIIKTLAELLQNNIKTACFDIDNKGIRLCMMDSLKHKLINLYLISEKFNEYKLKPKRLYIGINLSHLYKMLKSIKKKDSAELFIDDKMPNDLGIKVIPKENNRCIISYVKIQNIQNLETTLPTGYSKPVTIPSSEYQKLCKDVNNMAECINVQYHDSLLKFICNTGNVFSREVQFGEPREDSSEDSSEDYNEDFETSQLYRIMKISGLSNNIQIYLKEDLPILFKCSIGNLGEIEIYIKNKKQIESEEKDNFNKDSDGEVDEDDES